MTRRQAVQGPSARIDLVQASVLFVSVVLLALGLVVVATQGTTPLILIPALAAGVTAILDLRE